MQQKPVLNFLTVELLTLLYPLFLLAKNIFPSIMILVILVHLLRFYKYFNYINKSFKPNLNILLIYLILLICVFYSKNFVLLGILFGLMQYITYLLHEQIQKESYKWIEYHIDIPITILSSYISYIGFKNNNMLLTPFFGDLIYHMIEFYNKFNDSKKLFS